MLDVDPGEEVWNQPVTSYSCTKSDLSGTQAQMTCTVNYVMETNPSWNRQTPNIVSTTYKMALTLQNGQIVGGTHLAPPLPPNPPTSCI